VEAFALDFTDSSIFVKDTGTPANDIDQAGLFNAAGEAIGPQSRLTYTNPTPKQVLQADGLLKFGAHNLYVNSEAPADQSVTLVNGASYVMTVTGSVSTTVSGAATGTYTAGDNAFTAASGTLTCGSTSGSGTVHLRRTPSVSTYVKTGASAVYALPIDHDTSGNQIGVLVEPQATNLLPYSKSLSGTGWTSIASGAVTTNTTGALLGPDGEDASASLLTYNTAVTGGGTYALWRYTLTTSTVGTYTFSVWLKSGTITQTRIRLNDSGGNRAETEIALTSTWQRFDLSATTTDPITTISVDIGTDGNAAGAPTQTTGTLYAYGAQLETGSVATSYIDCPINATVTRSADDITEATSAMPYDATAGMLYTVFDRTTPGVAAAHELHDGTTNELISIRSLSTGRISYLVRDGGAPQVDENGPNNAVDPGSTGRAASVYAANDFAYAVNGGTVITDGAGTLPTVTTLSIGCGPQSGAGLGHIKQVLYLPRRVSNTDLQTLTSTGALP